MPPGRKPKEATGFDVPVVITVTRKGVVHWDAPDADGAVQAVRELPDQAVMRLAKFESAGEASEVDVYPVPSDTPANATAPAAAK
jgi:hypothetical protein